MTGRLIPKILLFRDGKYSILEIKGEKSVQIVEDDSHYLITRAGFGRSLTLSELPGNEINLKSIRRLLIDYEGISIQKI